MIEGPLWRFAVELYAQPGVAASCLHLQDDHGIDVSLLLACAWYGHCHQRALAREEVDRLADEVAPLRAEVQRLRADRRAIAALEDPEAYANAKREELGAEARQLARLAALLERADLGTPTEDDPVRACLTACAHGAAARDRLAPIIAALTPSQSA